MKQLFNTSDYFILLAALISLAISIGFWFNGYRDEGVFIGLWVPSILGFGNYIKNLVLQNKIDRNNG